MYNMYRAFKCEQKAKKAFHKKNVNKEGKEKTLKTGRSFLDGSNKILQRKLREEHDIKVDKVWLSNHHSYDRDTTQFQPDDIVGNTTYQEFVDKRCELYQDNKIDRACDYSHNKAIHDMTRWKDAKDKTKVKQNRRDFKNLKQGFNENI